VVVIKRKVEEEKKRRKMGTTDILLRVRAPSPSEKTDVTG
jgi:hypothetical protein